MLVILNTTYLHFRMVSRIFLHVFYHKVMCRVRKFGLHMISVLGCNTGTGKPAVFPKRVRVRLDFDTPPHTAYLRRGVAGIDGFITVWLSTFFN